MIYSYNCTPTSVNVGWKVVCVADGQTDTQPSFHAVDDYAELRNIYESIESNSTLTDGSPLFDASKLQLRGKLDIANRKPIWTKWDHRIEQYRSRCIE